MNINHIYMCENVIQPTVSAMTIINIGNLFLPDFSQLIIPLKHTISKLRRDYLICLYMQKESSYLTYAFVKGL